jgi:YHS domain-containing protein
MKAIKCGMQTLLVLILCQSYVFATDTTYFAVGNQGYDVVSYFTDHKPVKGNGDHVVMQNGINYLFVSDEHKKMFQANPEKYLPQFGGWCAMGLSLGKKIASDPLAWKIVDGKLYLNLNERVAKIWIKDIPGNIKKADANWAKIKNTDPSKL